ncbi:MAG: ferritin [Acidobacteriota bacterium]|nr:MAG: ferritin [Acidobacteriota bacterium]
MLDSKLEQAINKQINHEYTAAFHYLAMAAYFETQNLGGFASWMMVQHQEELDHAQRLFRYLLDRGGRVELEAIPKPQSEFKSVHAVFGRALELEKQNTRAINQLYRLAEELEDYPTKSHLQWFIDEQVEEEKTFDEAKGLLEWAGDDKGALLILNDKLGQRSAEPGSK